jgi:hypothetical protein
MIGADGRVLSFGDAYDLGGVWAPNQPIVGMAARN